MQVVDMMLTGNKHLRDSAALFTASMTMKKRFLFSHLLSTYPNIVSARDHVGRNALMIAIYQKLDTWYFDMIISHGNYSLHDVDKYGHTLAHYATVAGSKYYVEYFRQRAPELFYVRNECNQLPINCTRGMDPALTRRIFSISRALAREVSKETLQNLRRCASQEFVQYVYARSSLVEVLLDVDCEQQVRTVRRTY